MAKRYGGGLKTKTTVAVRAVYVYCLRVFLKVNVLFCFRFPIPDLRETTRPPWYHPSLRPEVLYVSLSDIRGSTLLHSDMLQGQVASTFDIQLKNARGTSQPERKTCLMLRGKNRKIGR